MKCGTEALVGHIRRSRRWRHKLVKIYLTHMDKPLRFKVRLP